MRGSSGVKYFAGNLVSSGLTYQLELRAEFPSRSERWKVHRQENQHVITKTDFVSFESLLKEDSWAFTKLAAWLKNQNSLGALLAQKYFQRATSD